MFPVACVPSPPFSIGICTYSTLIDPGINLDRLYCPTWHLMVRQIEVYMTSQQLKGMRHLEASPRSLSPFLSVLPLLQMINFLRRGGLGFFQCYCRDSGLLARFCLFISYLMRSFKHTRSLQSRQGMGCVWSHVSHYTQVVAPRSRACLLPSPALGTQALWSQSSGLWRSLPGCQLCHLCAWLHFGPSWDQEESGLQWPSLDEARGRAWTLVSC